MARKQVPGLEEIGERDPEQAPMIRGGEPWPVAPVELLAMILAGLQDPALNEVPSPTREAADSTDNTTNNSPAFRNSSP